MRWTSHKGKRLSARRFMGQFRDYALYELDWWYRETGRHWKTGWSW